MTQCVPPNDDQPPTGANGRDLRMNPYSTRFTLRKLAVTAAAVAAAVMSWSNIAAAQVAIPYFYDAPARELPGKPGSLIRFERYAFAPDGAIAYKVLYRSTGLRGEPIAVSGVVLIPPTPAPPGGRKIVAWAHPTTGVVRACAPSLYPTVFRHIPGLRDMLRRGYVVTATDYPGLGTAGPHPYLIGVSEARAVLDSVRAARAIPGAAAGNAFVAWGHSQGGHAVMWTGELAKRYAPELRLVGLAAAAPASELARLFDRDRKEFTGKVLTAMTIWSWSHVFGYSTAKLIDPAIVLSYRKVAEACSESLLSGVEALFAEKPLQREFLLANPTKIQPWRGQMDRNTTGNEPARLPVFMAQGLADKIVRPKITEDYVRRICRRGDTVRLVLMPGVTHHVIAVELRAIGGRMDGGPLCRRSGAEQLRRSAADLKFLQQPPQARPGTSNRKAALAS